MPHRHRAVQKEEHNVRTAQREIVLFEEEEEEVVVVVAREAEGGNPLQWACVCE